MELNFRPLRADEIDVRVGTVTPTGATFLLYKNARVDMSILDETVGAMNWQRHHSRENANCIVSIWDSEKKYWVSKEDTGTESNTEAEKGLASDSFKRACTNWGIGRELYESPFIRIKCETQKKSNGKGYELKDPYQFFGARVSEIEYEELEKKRIVTHLVIVDGDGNAIFSWDYGKKTAKKDKPKKKETSTPATTPEPASKKPIPKNRPHRDALVKYCREKKIDMNEVAKAFGLSNTATEEQFESALKEMKASEIR